YTEEVTEQAKKCASAMEEKGLPVVVLDSYDLEIMKQKYPEWGFEISLDMMTATSFVAKLIEEGKIAKKAALNIKGAPHDDDRLARVFHEFEPIRKMAEAAGFEKGEMFLKEKLAKSCGTLVAYSYMPEITLRVAGGRWADLLRTDCEAMLTANPQAYFLFEKTLPEGKKLVDLYGALL
ncbi:MAG: hypothetical protein IKU24_06445, partial [Clostridia bacterium]|nr:hypothetical protein [Clostridia bacterium]